MEQTEGLLYVHMSVGCTAINITHVFICFLQHVICLFAFACMPAHTSKMYWLIRSIGMSIYVSIVG